jgi:hypothetical protein
MSCFKCCNTWVAVLVQHPFFTLFFCWIPTRITRHHGWVETDTRVAQGGGLGRNLGRRPRLPHLLPRRRRRKPAGKACLANGDGGAISSHWDPSRWALWLTWWPRTTWLRQRSLGARLVVPPRWPHGRCWGLGQTCCVGQSTVMAALRHNLALAMQWRPDMTCLMSWRPFGMDLERHGPSSPGAHGWRRLGQPIAVICRCGGWWLGLIKLEP